MAYNPPLDYGIMGHITNLNAMLKRTKEKIIEIEKEQEKYYIFLTKDNKKRKPENFRLYDKVTRKLKVLRYKILWLEQKRRNFYNEIKDLRRMGL